MMMTPDRLLATGILPALSELSNLAGIHDTPEARRMLLTIGLQETGLRHRRQVSASGREDGPAASFWQFERGGGCRGVLTHKATAAPMRAMCALYNVEPTENGLWEAMRYQDVIAAAAARLLLFTLPAPLPIQAGSGWQQYLTAWRPGKPHPASWAACWETADRAVMAQKG